MPRLCGLRDARCRGVSPSPVSNSSARHRRLQRHVDRDPVDGHDRQRAAEARHRAEEEADGRPGAGLERIVRRALRAPFSATTPPPPPAPSIVPSSRTGREKNMPTKAPPEAPAMPHLLPPNIRVPSKVQAKSEAIDRSQNAAIQATATPLRVSGSSHFCSSTATSISVVPGKSGTTEPTNPAKSRRMTRDQRAISTGLIHRR